MIKFQRHISHDPINWYWFKNGFSLEEINKIESNALNFGVSKATVTNEGIVNEEIRKSAVGWIPQTREWQWLYQKLAEMVEEANNNVWKYNLYDMDEKIQYTEYYEDGGHYGYHLDVGPGYPLNQRKISITVQLSGPDEYEGGEFQMWRGGDQPEDLPKEKGCVLVFPSFVLHRVKPVTSGTRKSLVLWVGGESYR